MSSTILTSHSTQKDRTSKLDPSRFNRRELCNDVASTESCQVVSLSPQLRKPWDDYVNQHADGTLFHTLAWHDAVCEVFGHDDFYLIALRNNRIVGVLPLFRVISRLAGRLLVSAPYGVGGGIIADDQEAVSALFQAAKQIAQRDHIRLIDLRSEKAVIPDLPVVDRYAGFQKELPQQKEDVLDGLPRKARAAARNARNKYDLSVSYHDEHLKKVWELYSINMRRIGSLCYPYLFFQRLIEHTPHQHWVSLVYRQGQPVAGLVTFLFKDRVMPYFFGSTREANQCSAANYIYLTAMERGVEKGYRVFDFGRSRIDNTGSYNFKRFQGFEPTPLGYQCYISPGFEAPDLTPSNPKIRLARRLWTYLPLGLTQTLSATLTRHLPG